MKESDLRRFHMPPDEVPLGLGVERMVYKDPENSGKVISIGRREIEEEDWFRTRSRYYLIKLMHLLFPKNIPDIHFSYSNPNAMSRDKVELGNAHNLLRDNELSKIYGGKEFLTQAQEEDLEFKLGNYPAIKELNITLENAGFIIDSSGRNFGFDKNGNAQFVDTPSTFFEKDYDAVKIRKAVESKLQGKERQEALLFLDRLLEIYK